MKKIMLAMAVLIIAATFVSAAGTQDATSGDELVIGISLPTQREARWVSDKNTMEAYAKELGVDIRVAVADANGAEQASQVENLIAQGVDIMILAPHDAAGSATSAKKCFEEGIPVISYARLITNTPHVDLFMAIDPVEVGRMQGRFLAEKVPEGNYIFMSGAPTDYNATLFYNGAMEVLQPLVDNGKINVVANQGVDNWLPENALKIVENALTANNNDVDAILAPNDGTAGGAIVALEAQGLAGKVIITGQDAEVAGAKRILEGTQSMTVFKDTRVLGKAAIDAAIAIANGKALEINGSVDNSAGMVDALLIPPFVVTEDNLDALLIDSGYLNKSDVY